MLLLTDTDALGLPAHVAVEAMRRALLDHHAGRFLAPPRVRVPLAGNDAVFTVGGEAGGAQGFRVYRDGPAGGEQLVVVWGVDGSLEAVVTGAELGALRTGALGAVSVDALARPDASRVGVVGSGHQAWTQLWATVAMRPVQQVAVFSRHPGPREAFARRGSASWG